MAVSVRIEDEAFGDRRYDTLARLLGLPDADCARGKMAAVWRQCTQQQTHILDLETVVSILGANGPDALVKSSLGDVCDGGLRIRGTKGRIEWLARLRKNGAKGGRPKKTRCKPSGFENSPIEQPGANPPAPAPAPAPAKKEVPAPPDECLVLADHLRDLVLEQQPSNQLGSKPWPKTRVQWGHDFDKLVRLDGRAPEQIRTVLGWVFHAQTGDARFVVQSPQSLREKWDRIELRMAAPVTAKPAWQTQQTEIREIKRLG